MLSSFPRRIALLTSVACYPMIMIAPSASQTVFGTRTGRLHYFEVASNLVEQGNPAGNEDNMETVFYNRRIEVKKSEATAEALTPACVPVGIRSRAGAAQKPVSCG